MNKADKDLLNKVKSALAQYESKKTYYDFPGELEFKKLDKDNPRNYEYAVFYKGRFLAHLEDARGRNTLEITFVLEPMYWAHITKDNLKQIYDFMEKLEKQKRVDEK